MPNHLSPQLTELQRRFVEALVEIGDPRAAARAAGYSESTVNTGLSSLLKSPHLNMAIARATQERLAVCGATGLSTLEFLCRNAAKEQTRAYCAVALMDRAGFVPPKARQSEGDDTPLHEMSADRLRDIVLRHEAELASRARDVTPRNAQAPSASPDDDIDLIG